jgi:hypothetical protein
VGKYSTAAIWPVLPALSLNPIRLVILIRPYSIRSLNYPNNSWVQRTTAHTGLSTRSRPTAPGDEGEI